MDTTTKTLIKGLVAQSLRRSADASHRLGQAYADRKGAADKERAALDVEVANQEFNYAHAAKVRAVSQLRLLIEQSLTKESGLNICVTYLGVHSAGEDGFGFTFTAAKCGQSEPLLDGAEVIVSARDVELVPMRAIKAIVNAITASTGL